MEQIKNYFKGWGISRIIRIILAGSLGGAYFYNGEFIYLFACIVLAVQAIFNLSCAGGSCSANYTNENKPLIKTEKYEPNKTK